MATGRTLTVSLVANTNSFRRGMMSAVRDAQGFQGKMTAIGANLRGVVGPALGAAAVAAGAFALKLGVDGVKAAMAEEKQLVSLNKALQAVGQGFQTDAVANFVDDLQFSAGVADDQLRPAFQRLLLATRDVTQSQELLSIALDVSAGTGRDLESVTLALSKAALGQFTALRRLGIPLDDAAIKSKDLAAVSAQLNKTFSGQAAAAAKTYEGQIKRLGVAFEELQESFGAGFLAGLGQSSDGTDDLADSLRDLQPAFEALGTQIGQAVGALGDLSSGISKLGDDMNVPRNKGFSEFLSYFVGITGLVKAAGFAVKNLAGDTTTAADTHRDYADAAVRAQRMTAGMPALYDDLGNEIEDAGDAAAEAAEKFDLFSAAMSRTNAVIGYQSALDDLKESLADNGKVVSIFTRKGRDNAEALIGVAEAAAAAMEATDSQAQKALLASGALDTLKSTMDNTKMDPSTKAALIAPFQALLDDLEESGIDIDSLQRKLDLLKSKTITITTRFVTLGDGTYVGTPPPGGYPTDGETPTRTTRSGFSQPSGISIGSITVQSAPGERAEESVPRALRRYAFVAGLNG